MIPPLTLLSFSAPTSQMNIVNLPLKLQWWKHLIVFEYSAVDK